MQHFLVKPHIFSCQGTIPTGTFSLVDVDIIIGESTFLEDNCEAQGYLTPELHLLSSRHSSAADRVRGFPRLS
jgi:hypothetical protein